MSKESELCKDATVKEKELQDLRDAQIEATKFWSETFYPLNKSLYEKNKKEMEKQINETIKSNNQEIENLNKILNY